MADCFLFFRFWPGFSDPFPVDRFNSIADSDLPRALELYAREEIGRPEVRHRIKETAKARRRNVIDGVKRQSSRRLGAPRNRPVGRLAKRDWYWPQIRRAERKDPLVCRLGAYQGWWQKRWFESLPFGPQVWFCRMSDCELADVVVRLLNGRTDLDYGENKLECVLQPRFGLAKDVDTTTQIVAQRCITSIRRGEVPDVRASKMMLSMGQKAMRIADEMLEAATHPTSDTLQDGLIAKPAELATGDETLSNHGETGVVSPEGGGKSPTGKGKNINGRMLDAIQEDQEALGWNSRQWAEHLKCAKSSVVETKTWKDLQMRRERDKAERAKDRRRRPKTSDMRRD